MPRIAAIGRGWPLRLLGAMGLALAGAAAAAAVPLVTAYTSAEIGADAASYRTIQDSNGTLFFGSNALLTFDGSRWSKHEVPNAYCVYGLAFGQRDRIWV